MPEPEITDGGIWICHTCKTVIGPIIDDDKNKCGCDVYEFEYSRYIPDRSDPAKPSEGVKRLEKIWHTYKLTNFTDVYALTDSIAELVGEKYD